MRIPPRYEFKYLVTRGVAAQLRAMLPVSCALDPASEARPQHRYPITSLYLDGPSLPTHRAKVNRERERFKLRVRSYGPETPVFLEIKRRVGDVVIKRRARVPVESWRGLASGALAPTSSVAADFQSLVGIWDARPAALVSYDREAWVSFLDEYARVTFDTRLRFEPRDEYDLLERADVSRPMDDATAFGDLRADVIVELKFAERIPIWMERMGHRLDLFRRGFSKYCTAIERIYVDDRRLFPAARTSVFHR